MIAILDYGVGNLNSIHNMLKRNNIKSIITNEISEIKKSSKYILPGVGSFSHGIKSLKNSSFLNILENEILWNKKPILGICLGMQFFTNYSEEGGDRGLGWINASTLKFNFDNQNLAVPHIGWNQIIPKKENCIFKNLTKNEFYFLHSFYVFCHDSNDVLANSSYGISFASSIRKGNIYGIQAHPEKSHIYGKKLFENFNNIKC